VRHSGTGSSAQCVKQQTVDEQRIVCSGCMWLTYRCREREAKSCCSLCQSSLVLCALVVAAALWETLGGFGGLAVGNGCGPGCAGEVLCVEWHGARRADLRQLMHHPPIDGKQLH
jgi:hypothetical protein